MVAERVKYLDNKGEIYSHYFWRLASRAELDLVEEKGGKLTGYEIKYGKKGAKAPKSWLETYPGSDFRVMNRDNWLEYVK